ncbi:MAG TPA: RNA-binding protein S1 [Bacilli bacterium]|nr:RNA-binding protein S1 [Bacilli bacterium]
MSIEVGSKLQGKVTGITHFGAFVELPGGTTGLVHISEVADNYVKDINEFLKVGDEVLVKVVNVEKDGKIGLSIRKAREQETPSRPPADMKRPPRSGGGQRGAGQRNQRTVMSFEDKMNRFLKDSEERLSTLRRQTDSKRGGRGARRG